jgi:hypothetical protein
MTGKVCPFCGIATDVPHESQEGCIAALHGEIARMRQVLDHVRTFGPSENHAIEERDRI